VGIVADAQNDGMPHNEVRVIGHIKWFDPAKGYGFIVPETAEGVILSRDVMLHISCLRDYGETTADEGARIVCDAVQRNSGWQVSNILDMDRPRTSVMKESGEAVTYVRVIVKWFNAAKGFGFVNRTDSDEDIFIHISIMRKVGIDSLETGDALDVVIGDGQKGKNVILIGDRAL